MRIIAKKVLCVGIIVIGIMSCGVPVIANTTLGIGTYSEEDIQPRTDIKEWVYKVMNGNLYKRLYNYTRNRWEGDWIFVASGVEEI